MRKLIGNARINEYILKHNPGHSMPIYSDLYQYAVVAGIFCWERPEKGLRLLDYYGK